MRYPALFTVMVVCALISVCLAETWGEHKDKTFGKRAYGTQEDLYTVKWEYDKYREEMARVAAQEKQVSEFNRTNQDRSVVGMVSRNLLFDWRPEKGGRELGYRSDGIVVWRELPEGK